MSGLNIFSAVFVPDFVPGFSSNFDSGFSPEFVPGPSVFFLPSFLSEDSVFCEKELLFCEKKESHKSFLNCPFVLKHVLLKTPVYSLYRSIW